MKTKIGTTTQVATETEQVVCMEVENPITIPHHSMVRASHEIIGQRVIADLSSQNQYVKKKQLLKLVRLLVILTVVVKFKYAQDNCQRPANLLSVSQHN